MSVLGNSRQNALGRWLLRGVGLGLLVWLLLRIDPKQLVEAWWQADKGLLLLATLMAFPMMFIKVQRWRYLLKAQEIDYPLKEAVTAYFGAYYVGIVTPGRVGEILKVLYLCENDVSMGTAMVSVVVDRVLDLLVLVLLALLGIGFVPQLAAFRELLVWGWGVVLIVIGGLFLIRTRIAEMSLRWVTRRLSRVSDDYSNQARHFVSGLQQVVRVRNFYVALMLSALSWFVILLACHLIARSLSIEVSFWYLSFAVAIGSLVALLPFSIAGIGLRDSAVVAVLGLIAVAQHRALAFSFLYFAVFGMVLGLVGAVFWYQRPIMQRSTMQD